MLRVEAEVTCRKVESHVDKHACDQQDGGNCRINLKARVLRTIMGALFP
jgi:hypothetical protein